MDGRAQVKEEEVRRACAYLGIEDVRFFRHDDAAVTIREDLIARMASLIRDVRPDVVITHHPHEMGGVAVHHAVTGQLVLEGIVAGGSVGANDPNPPHRVAQIFFTTANLLLPVNVLTAGVGWYPDLLVDITDVVEAKVRALDALRSQRYGGNYARKATEFIDGAIGGRPRAWRTRRASSPTGPSSIATSPVRGTPRARLRVGGGPPPADRPAHRSVRQARRLTPR